MENMAAMLDDSEAIRRKDPGGMLETLEGLPGQCLEALQMGQEVVLPEVGRPRLVVLAGLGGSAIGGDLVRVLVSRQAGVPVLVVRDYNLPACVDQDALVFLTSYSGNTEETLEAYRQAGDKGAARIVLTTGGRLAELAERDGVLSVRVPGGLPPRSAIGYLSLPALLILARLGLTVFDPEAGAELLEVMGRVRDELGAGVPVAANRAKSLALKLYGKVPVIYGSCGTTEAAAIRWKGQINENSKSLAFWNLFPELNHNEVVGSEAPPELLRQMAVLILEDPGDHPRIKARIEITAELLGKRVASITRLQGEGDSLLARIFSLIYLGDFTSVYLALLYNIDPRPVRVIDHLKQELARR